MEVLVQQQENNQARSSRPLRRTGPASSSSRESSASSEDVDPETIFLERLGFQNDGLISLGKWLTTERSKPRQGAASTGQSSTDTIALSKSQALVGCFADALGDRLPIVLSERLVIASMRRQSRTQEARALYLSSAKRPVDSTTALDKETVRRLARDSPENDLEYTAICFITDADNVLCRLCNQLIPFGPGDAKMAFRAHARPHLLAHLEPYCCTYDDCPSGGDTYGSIRAWSEHESHCHRAQWRCPECEPVIYLAEENGLEEHLRTQHGDYYAKEDIAAILKYSSCGKAEQRTDCRFCGDSLQPELLVNHVAAHFDTLAILALYDLSQLLKEDTSDAGRETGPVVSGVERSSYRLAHNTKPPQPINPLRSASGYEEACEYITVTH